MYSSLGYDPELPAGFQDADIEMRELQDAARRAPRETIRNPQGYTERAIPMKDGTTVAKGAPVQFIPDNPSRCLVQGERSEPYKVRVTTAFKSPTEDQLEAWVADGVCETVTGETTEPDGWTGGVPSWLLALGMI